MAQAAIDREAVKTLAIAVGVREAARQLGLNENTVRQWSRRFSWFPKPVTIISPRSNQAKAVSSVTTASDALRETLQKRSNTTKLGLSKAAAKAAEHLGEQSPRSILAYSEDMYRVARTASVVHQWEAANTGNGPIQFNVLAQRAYFGTPTERTEGE